MNAFIVKVRVYDNENELINFGTGVLTRHGKTVLTSAHVVCGARHTVVIPLGDEECEVETTLLRRNEVAAVLAIENSLATSGADIFSDQEILEIETPWSAEGYVTAEQIAHSITGVGIVFSKSHDCYWDYELTQICSGHAQNYKGLSGTPVLSYGRIVGILQEQSPLADGRLGLRMSSTKLFKDLLEKDDIKPNAYELAILASSQKMSAQHIEENKRSGKYIPDIFVEEGEYKEKLRYFAEPYCFLKKAIEECRQMDFFEQNRQLTEQNQPIIDTSILIDYVSTKDMDLARIQTLEFLSETLNKLEVLSQDTQDEEISTEEYYIKHSNRYHSLKYAIEDIRSRVKMTAYSYILLSKRAGQGKTNLLCDFTENFLLKKNYCVWYYNAYELRVPPMVYLEHELELQGQYSSKYGFKVLEKRWRRTGKPAIIVIDGLNENMAISDFGRCIKDFLNACAAMPYLKVVMTTREELIQERFGCLLQMDEINNFCHIPIFRSSDDFKDRIFWGYIDFFDVGIRPHTLLPTTYKLLTEDILLLRFFCEVESHKRDVYLYNIYKYEVFQRYLDKKAEEYEQTELVDTKELFYNLLDHICQIMLDRQNYLQIPIMEFSNGEQKLLKKMLENDVLFKGEVQLETGLLKRERTVISFTFDEFRDFCLTNYLLEHSNEKETFIALWNDFHKRHTTICEGMERYIFYLAFTQYREKIFLWLQECPEYENLYWENIWDVEDKYITPKDIEIWKGQLISNGPHSVQIVHHLFIRCDKSYFSMANIQVLFKVMDELLLDYTKFDKFIRVMFGPERKERYNIISTDKGRVYPYNNFLKELYSLIEQYTDRYREYFYLTIYLYELSTFETQNFWLHLFSELPEIGIGVLSELNLHPRYLIRGNVKNILEALLKTCQDKKYRAVLARLLANNDYNLDFKSTINLIAKVFDKE